MANVCHGSPLVRRSPDAAPRHFDYRKRRNTSASPDPATSAGQSRKTRIKASIKWWVVTLLPVALISAFCFVGVMLFFSWVQSVANGLNGIGRGLEQLGQSMEIGGTTADAAASVAASQPPGSLSVSELNTELHQYAWVDGATSVPTSRLQRPTVGVNIVGTSVETAVQPVPGMCSFGLSVTSSHGPVTTEDHLPGPGSYYQDVFQTSQCIADQAPTSGWQSWLGTP
jgi:hypothetical protein